MVVRHLHAHPRRKPHPRHNQLMPTTFHPAVSEPAVSQPAVSHPAAFQTADVARASRRAASTFVSTCLLMTCLSAQGFREPDPIAFDDHKGYTQLFDGVSLKDWVGNPEIWRVENGAIVGESTKEKPSGNSYISYHGITAKDFDLKFEIKVE